MGLFLTILKIVSLLVAALFSLAEQGEDGRDKKAARRKQKRARIAIMVSLVLAIMGEGLETVHKRAEATRQEVENRENAAKMVTLLEQADRSLHPIFPLKFSFHANIGLNSPVLADLKKGLLEEIAKQAPDEDRRIYIRPQGPFPADFYQGSAFVMANAELQMRVFIERHPSPGPIAPIEDPDLSFAVKSTFSTFSPVREDEKVPDHVLDDRDFKPHVDYWGGDQLGYSGAYIPIKQEDCWYNGSITSVSDLLGARFEVEVSPAVDGTIRDSISLNGVSIVLPGDRELQLNSDLWKRFSDEYNIRYVLDLPATKEEFEKLILP